jgi:non-heme chloroperoxidase
MPFATTQDGARISFRTEGVGPPHVLMLHGWAGSARYFEETIAGLDTTRVRVITVDLSDHGESGEGGPERTLDAIADEGLAVADDAGADSFVVLGFSMSAKFAQYLSCANADRVLGQILVAGCPATQIPLPPELYDDWMGRAGDADALVDIVRQYSTRSIAPAVLERFGGDAARVPRAALEETMTACISTSFADRLGGLDVPTLVVAGRGDEIFPPQLLRDTILDALPQARLVVLDCGHEIPAEAPEELARLIEAFLAGTPAASGRLPAGSRSSRDGAPA